MNFSENHLLGDKTSLLEVVCGTLVSVGGRNATSSGEQTAAAAAVRSMQSIRYYINDVVLPIIFGVGIAGNLLNLALLGGKRFYQGRRTAATTFERSAVAGLVALALSDLMFCIIGFSPVFVGRGTGYSSTSGGNGGSGDGTGMGWRVYISIYYVMHRGAFLNVFLFTSTWIIVLVSFERYLAVCHPFVAGSVIRVSRTVVAHVVIFVVAVVVNVPLFLKYTIAIKTCLPVVAVAGPAGGPTAMTASSAAALNCSRCYYPVPSEIYFSQPVFVMTHRAVWFTVGTFVPLGLLLFSNVCLLCELVRIRSAGVAYVERALNLRLTLTLVAIVICFLLLVCPSMIVQLLVQVTDLGTASSVSMSTGSAAAAERAVTQTTAESVSYDIGTTISYATGIASFTENISMRLKGVVIAGGGGGVGRAVQIAILATNVMQALKFASNFLLYCAVNRAFRQTFAKFVRGDYCRKRRSGVGSNRTAQQRDAVMPGYRGQRGGTPLTPAAAERLRQLQEQPLQQHHQQP